MDWWGTVNWSLKLKCYLEIHLGKRSDTYIKVTPNLNSPTENPMEGLPPRMNSRLQFKKRQNEMVMPMYIQPNRHPIAFTLSAIVVKNCAGGKRKLTENINM